MGPNMDKHSFTSSAAGFARSALSAWADGDRAVALLHAGVSLEHLCKALLCSLSPALVAQGDADSLLHLVGHGKHAKKAPKTVTATEALNRVKRVLDDPRLDQSEIGLLLDLRNGVAHAGLLPAGELEKVMTAWAGAEHALVDAVGQDWRIFLAEQARLGEAIEQQRDAEIVARVEKLIGEAGKIGRHIDGLPEYEQLAVLEAAETSVRRWPADESIQDTLCPACGRTAIMSGEVEVDFEPDYDVEDGFPYVSGLAGTAYFLARNLRCPYCKLELDGIEELEAAPAVDTKWELRSATDDEYREYYSDSQ